MTSSPTVAYVGTYPPQECGIATFTKDLADATDLCGWSSIVVAVEEAEPGGGSPDPKVVYTITREERADYARAARIVGALGADLLCIQHEYGIFGGDHGEYVLALARAAAIPVIVTLHTVLPQPSAAQRRILKEMEPFVSGFVVMARKGVELLLTAYGLAANKVHFIPHGAPDVPLGTEKAAKRALGLSGRRVLSTFGLVAPSKGIEDVISALPAVVKKDSRVVYLVLGATHPVVKRQMGEEYREELAAQAAAAGLTEHVRFVDQYLSLPELIGYLLATDIYVTPYYANPYQITSGTLAYAMALGRVIVSTPYTYAEELLADGRGVLYPFRDIQKLSEALTRLLSDDELFARTHRRAYDYGRDMIWPCVGLEYARLFQRLLRAQGLDLPPDDLNPGQPS